MLKLENIRIKLLFITLSISFFFVSCAKKKSLREVLTNNSYRYWRYTEEISPCAADSFYNKFHRTRTDSCILYFDKTGLFLFYLGDFEDLQHCHIPRWELINDSTIYFFDSDIKIKEYSNDKIFLYEKLNSGTVVVDTLKAIDIKDIPKKYRKYRQLDPDYEDFFVF